MLIKDCLQQTQLYLKCCWLQAILHLKHSGNVNIKSGMNRKQSPRLLYSTLNTLISKKDWIELPIVLEPNFLKPPAP